MSASQQLRCGYDITIFSGSLLPTFPLRAAFRARGFRKLLQAIQKQLLPCSGLGVISGSRDADPIDRDSERDFPPSEIGWRFFLLHIFLIVRKVPRNDVFVEFLVVPVFMLTFWGFDDFRMFGFNIERLHLIA